MILLQAILLVCILGLIYYLCVHWLQSYHLKKDTRFKYLNTAEDEVLFTCRDCTCTTHYLICKTGIKRVFCYEDILWLYTYYHRYMANKEMGLILKIYTAKGKGFRLIYGTDETERTFNKVIKIIQEKNPNCLFGDNEENQRLFKSKVKYR